MKSDYEIALWITQRKEELIGGIIILFVCCCAGFIITACFVKNTMFWFILAVKTAIAGTVFTIASMIVFHLIYEIRKLKRN